MEIRGLCHHARLRLASLRLRRRFKHPGTAILRFDARVSSFAFSRAVSLRKAGVVIGERAYGYMVQSGALVPQPTPLEILEGLKKAASEMIQDQRGRGWEIREVTEGRITMRRTQTFNCLLQEGLLQSLVSRTGAQLARCEHVSCTRQGALFCDYDVTWMQ